MQQLLLGAENPTMSIELLGSVPGSTRRQCIFPAQLCDGFTNAFCGLGPIGFLWAGSDTHKPETSDWSASVCSGILKMSRV